MDLLSSQPHSYNILINIFAVHVLTFPGTCDTLLTFWIQYANTLVPSGRAATDPYADTWPVVRFEYGSIGSRGVQLAPLSDDRMDTMCSPGAPSRQSEAICVITHVHLPPGNTEQ